MLVVLVLEGLREVPIVHIHMRCLCYFVVLLSTSFGAAGFVTQPSHKAQPCRSSQGASGAGRSQRSSASSDTQEMLMLLRGLVASTLSGATGFVTQSSAPTGSVAASQFSTEGPRSTSSPGTSHGSFGWYRPTSS